MKTTFSQLAENPIVQGEALTQPLAEMINQNIEKWSDDFVQDMRHISESATYDGNIAVDQVSYLKENLYRCDYSYDWTIAWNCSGIQDSGRVNEKVRFTVDASGEVEFKFLKLA